MSLGDDATIAGYAAALARGETTSVALTERCLERIAALDRRLNAFISVSADQALATAAAADRARRAGTARTALHGIPIALKDLIDEAGVRTTAASLVRRDVVASTDAPVTAFLRAAGAVLIGKTNLHEFAFGPTGEESAFGPMRHPDDPARMAGGSSGGSAVAVATGMAVAAIGTDTGGSIRIPAAACGVVGLKPTWGEIAADGVVPLSRQLDHVGPLTRTVTDAWLMHETLAGRAPAAGAAGAARPLAGLRIGRLGGYFAERIDAEVAAAIDGALARLQAAGAIVTPVEIPEAHDAATVYLHLVLADAAAYHARTLESRPGDYTPGIRLRLEMGRYVRGEDYVRALRGRDIIAAAIDRALTTCDVLLCPTLPVPAPPIGSGSVGRGVDAEPVRAALLRLTQPFNLGRQPVLSLPCGRTASTALPVGLQLVGARGHTSGLLAVGLSVERALAQR